MERGVAQWVSLLILECHERLVGDGASKAVEVVLRSHQPSERCSPYQRRWCPSKLLSPFIKTLLTS